MSLITTDWESVFELYGTKTVSRTDKARAAYVLSAPQLAAVHAAGVKPRTGRQFPIAVLSGGRALVEASFYYSIRNAEKRSPEPRMGGEFISAWLEPGDRVVIGNVGKQLFAAKLSGTGVGAVEVAQAVVRTASKRSKKALFDRARLANGKPAKRIVGRNEYVRNSLVIAGALIRANATCEMPGCATPLFEKDDGTLYLEVHHIVPLAEDGEDSLDNAAALCPNCHRRLHHGKGRLDLRAQLKARISAK